MPSFTFERLSPPLRRGPPAPEQKKPRSRIGQFLDRFADTRTRRALGRFRRKTTEDAKSSSE